MVLCNNNDDKSKNAALLSIVRELNTELDNLKRSFQNLNDENKFTLVPCLEVIEQCLDIIEKVTFMLYNKVILDYIRTRDINKYDYPEIYKQAIKEYSKRRGL